MLPPTPLTVTGHDRAATIVSKVVVVKEMGCCAAILFTLIVSGILMCIISCQTPHLAYGDTVAQDPPSELPLSAPVDQGAMALGLPGLPGWPLDPVAVNNFESEAPGSKLAALGAEVMDAAESAVEPLPPRFEPLPELGPQRMWQPTWQGVGPTFVDKACEFFYPNPRLWARDLNELQFRRGLSMGQDNLFEPVRARQSHIQLLAAESRSKRDFYTKSTLSNDLSHTTCSQIARQVPEYVKL